MEQQRRWREEFSEGFTFIELMVAMMIFTIAIVSLMAVYTGVVQLNESNRNMTRAVADARVVLEVDP